VEALWPGRRRLAGWDSQRPSEIEDAASNIGRAADGVRYGNACHIRVNWAALKRKWSSIKICQTKKIIDTRLKGIHDF
jgi:hypothetical protein